MSWVWSGFDLSFFTLSTIFAHVPFCLIVKKLAVSGERTAMLGFWQNFAAQSFHRQGKLIEGTWSTLPAISLPLFVGAEKLPCLYPSRQTLNEINKFRLNWQLPSVAIILLLMSLCLCGGRLGLRVSGVGCGAAALSNTKK